MTKRSLTRWTFFLVVLLLLATVAAPALDAVEVRIELTRDALILVPVTVNDGTTVDFLLDTGADTTIVDVRLAKKLGLGTLKQVPQATVTGSQTVAVSQLAKLAVGGMEVQQLAVLKQDLSGLRQVDGRIAGILGQNFLVRFNYLVDYRARSLQITKGDELRWTMEEEAAEGAPAPVKMEQRRMMVAVHAGWRGKTELRLLLDSGANAAVLGGKAARDLDCETVQSKLGVSSAGMALMRTGRLDLRVAAHEYRDVPVSLIGDQLPREIGDGLLPMSLFERVYVNNAEGYVVLNPRMKKAPVDLVARVDGE